MIFQFKDFPEIPIYKRFIGVEPQTKEQAVVNKIQNNKPLDTEDDKILNQCSEFYKDIIPRLKKVNFNDFTTDELNDFKEYLNYVFNFSLLSKCNLTLPATIRVVKNKSVFGKEESLPNLSYLTYPSLNIVKKTGRYNRANTLDSNVFYGTQNFDSAIMEVKPLPGEMITIGTWRKNEPEKGIMCCSIMHEKALEANDDLKEAYQSFKKSINDSSTHKYYVDLIDLFNDFLVEQYSKQVENHLDYFYSAVYTEILFSPNGKPPYGCLIYPSIQNAFKYQNIAIQPTYFDKHFSIADITELTISETFYKNGKEPAGSFLSRYITPINVRRAKYVEKDGTIVW